MNKTGIVMILQNIFLQNNYRKKRDF